MTIFWAKTLVYEAYKKKRLTEQQAKDFIKFISNVEHFKCIESITVIKSIKNLNQNDTNISYEHGLDLYYKYNMIKMEQLYPHHEIQDVIANKLRVCINYINKTTCLNNFEVVKLSEITDVEPHLFNDLFTKKEIEYLSQHPNFKVKERIELSRYLVESKYEYLIDILTLNINAYNEEFLAEYDILLEE